MSGTKGMSHYSYTVKREAVRLHVEEQLSYGEIACRMEIRKRDGVERWVQQFRQEGEAGLKKHSGGPHRKRRNEAERIEQLEMENTLLKKLHTELRKAMLARRDIGSSNTIEEITR